MAPLQKGQWNPQIGWNEGYAIGNAQLDEEHRKLVGLLVNLNDFLVADGFVPSGEDFATIVSYLVDYTKTHFTSEQSLMAKHAYPALQDHIKLHAVFVAAVDGLSAKVKAGQTVDLNSLYDFLFDWLIDHILHEDKKFARYLREKGVR